MIRMKEFTMHTTKEGTWGWRGGVASKTATCGATVASEDWFGSHLQFLSCSLLIYQGKHLIMAQECGPLHARGRPEEAPGQTSRDLDLDQASVATGGGN